MIFCLICDKWLPYCLCHRDELDFGRTEQRAFEFVYGKQSYEEAVRSYKEGLERNSNPQPKEPVFIPEDAIYAHSLGGALMKAASFLCALSLITTGCGQSPVYVARGTVRSVQMQNYTTTVTFEHDNGELRSMLFCSDDPVPPLWTGLRVRMTYRVDVDGHCTKLLQLQRLKSE